MIKLLDNIYNNLSNLLATLDPAILPEDEATITEIYEDLSSLRYKVFEKIGVDMEIL